MTEHATHQQLPKFVEPIPDHYRDSSLATEMGETNPNLVLVENLRSDLFEKPFTDETVDTLYRISRILGDPTLYGAEEGDDVAYLLDQTRHSAAPAYFKAESNIPGALGGHSETEGISMGYEGLKAIADKNTAELTALGFEEKQPGDIAMSTFVRFMAHESAHAMLGGISNLGRDIPGLPAEGGGSLLATRTFLGKHPEEAFTGNWRADTFIHEERFAEGYAQVAARVLLETLGYEDAQIDTLIKAQNFDISNVVHPEGKHQIDHLDKINGTTSPADIMKEAITDQQELISTNQDYPGELGYFAPLSLETVVLTLKEISQAYMAKDLGSVVQAPEEWQKKVEAAQSDGTKAVLAMLRQNRLDVLSPKTAREKGLAKRIRRLGGTMLGKRPKTKL